MMNPDYEKIAEAYRIPVRTVVDRTDLDDAITEMLTVEGPFLLQVAVMEEDNVLPMCFPGHDVDDMVLTIES
jgi:acetolactate synthase-1/2/3 large subunit